MARLRRKYVAFLSDSLYYLQFQLILFYAIEMPRITDFLNCNLNRTDKPFLTALKSLIVGDSPFKIYRPSVLSNIIFIIIFSTEYIILLINYYQQKNNQENQKNQKKTLIYLAICAYSSFSIMVFLFYNPHDSYFILYCIGLGLGFRLKLVLESMRSKSVS